MYSWIRETVEVSLLRIPAYILISWTAFFALKIFSRLYLHPLARFPGPKLAAATHLYEYYHDLLNHGKLVFKLQDLHNQYGPIVRINPRELHIQDSSFYDELNSGRPDKDSEWVEFSMPGSIFSTASHELHHLRRAPLNQYFSKRAVNQLAPLIEEKVEKLCSRFNAVIKTGEVIYLDAAFMSLTTDVISDYAFARHWNYLDAPDFNEQWLGVMRGDFIAGLPRSWVKCMVPPLYYVLEWRAQVMQNIVEVFQNEEVSDEKNRTIFHELKGSNLPKAELELQRVADEACIIVGAGAETTARTLKLIVFYLLEDHDSLIHLEEELRASKLAQTELSNPASRLTQLEQLPYLSAVIQEGLRLSFGVTTRLPRVKNEVVHYREWTIPPRTPISMEPYSVLTDPLLFPEPHAFRPKRWLGEHRLDKYQVAFGKGTRQCIGMNVAYAELYMTIATLFTRFDFELFETSYADIKMEHDFFTAATGPDSKGVQVKVTGSATM